MRKTVVGEKRALAAVKEISGSFGFVEISYG